MFVYRGVVTNENSASLRTPPEKEMENSDVYAYFCYRSGRKFWRCCMSMAYGERLQRKGYRNRKLTDWEKRGNHTRSKIRSRIEHVFESRPMMAGDLLLRTIHFARAWVKIGPQEPCLQHIQLPDAGSCRMRCIQMVKNLMFMRDHKAQNSWSISDKRGSYFGKFNLRPRFRKKRIIRGSL